MQLAAPISPDPRAPLARANPVARLGAAGILMVALFLSVDALTAGLLLLVALAAIPLSGLPPLALVRRAWLILLLALSVAAFNGLLGAPAGPVALTAGPISLHRDTLLAGAALGVRVLGIALTGVVALATVDPTDLADALMQQLHLPARFALAALAAVRLLPVLADEWRLIGLARRARGVSAAGPAGWVRLQAGRLLALFVSAIRRATRLALAMEARGLGSGRHRSVARPQRMARRDWVLLAAALLAGLAASGVSAAAGSYRFLFG